MELEAEQRPERSTELGVARLTEEDRSEIAGPVMALRAEHRIDQLAEIDRRELLLSYGACGENVAELLGAEPSGPLLGETREEAGQKVVAQHVPQRHGIHARPGSGLPCDLDEATSSRQLHQPFVAARAERHVPADPPQKTVDVISRRVSEAIDHRLDGERISEWRTPEFPPRFVREQ